VQHGNSFSSKAQDHILLRHELPHLLGIQDFHGNQQIFLGQATLLQRSLVHIQLFNVVAVQRAVAWREVLDADAFGLLSGKAWLNDDVVIPLAIRSLFPAKKLTYLPNIIVEDISPIRTGSESTRRVRLIRGNLDWVRESFWRHSPVVQILALRRISRMTWAYWFIGLISPLLLLGLGGDTAGRAPEGHGGSLAS
jgi:hypothetical protein